MDIGTGKDLKEFQDVNASIAYHLIDLIEPQNAFAIHQFQAAFKTVFTDVQNRRKLPVLCGGSGLYLEAVIRDFTYTSVPNLPALRIQLEAMSDFEIQELFSKQAAHPFKLLADTSTRKRTIRAIEILQFLTQNPQFKLLTPKEINPFIIGLSPEIEVRRNNILQRLKERIQEGLIEEVEQLLAEGITHERLQFFGLEYKFVSEYLQGKISKDYLIEHLGIAIQQFAKRQMTYFRKMEKSGLSIHWTSTKEEALSIVPPCF